MRILVDTNVLLDYLTMREPFYHSARKIIKLCKSEEIRGARSAQSAADIFYILRKDVPIDRRREILLQLIEIFHVVSVDYRELKNALLNENFSDFEDCLQAECAVSFSADYIVTRDKNDYRKSLVPIISPDDFCELIESEEG